MVMNSQNTLEQEKTDQSAARFEGQPSILFVDDEIPMVLGLKRNLRAFFNVEGALGAEQALEMMEKNQDFAVVVSDMRMPDMDGASFLAEVRRRFPSIVRIMLTGDQSQQTPQEAISKGGVFRLLHKPCSEEQMREVLCEALKEHERLKDHGKKIEILLEAYDNDRMTMLQKLLDYSDIWSKDSAQPDFVRSYCQQLDQEAKQVFEQANRLMTFMALADSNLRPKPHWIAFSELFDLLQISLCDKLQSKECLLEGYVAPACTQLALDQKNMHMALSILLEQALESMPIGSHLRLCLVPEAEHQGVAHIYLEQLNIEPEKPPQTLALPALESKLVEHICHMHDGRLVISHAFNAPGQGHLAFSLFLPL
ncbi:MAG: response regulator [Cohaesibacter sp.]|nr:response regulator [Cohaesibacter sp.]